MGADDVLLWSPDPLKYLPSLGSDLDRDLYGVAKDWRAKLWKLSTMVVQYEEEKIKFLVEKERDRLREEERLRRLREMSDALKQPRKAPNTAVKDKPKRKVR